ncbi:MAG: YbhB/YbcL family Raf kinase inhibitor-like protein, partial [Deltaproteobacteria bacterium]|nr:YbhB/YbcL family Raf kinase inhibitor-like protein [Deltaproteobacteria bacterium]
MYRAILLLLLGFIAFYSYGNTELTDKLNLVSERESSGNSNFTLRSPAFSDGGVIPRIYTCDGRNISPPLSWSGAPPRTKSFVLIMEDLDASGEPIINWVVYDITARRDRLEEDIPKQFTVQIVSPGFVEVFRQALNSAGARRVGYSGPCPPSGRVHN